MDISRRGAAFGLVAVTLSVAGCSSPPPPAAVAEAPPPPPPPPPMGDAVVVEEVAVGTVVHLHPEQKLIVKLPGESGSTGYRWKVVSGVGRALLQTDRSFQSDAPPPEPGAPPMVGGGGTAVFTFVAKHRGRSDLKLALLPPGHHRKPAKLFHVYVDIRP